MPLSNKKIREILDGAPEDLKWLAKYVNQEHIQTGCWYRKNKTDIGYSILEYEHPPGAYNNWFSFLDVAHISTAREILTLRQRVEELESQQSEVAARAVADASREIPAPNCNCEVWLHNRAKQLRKGEGDE